MSRHRGAKHRRRYELLGGISLLSPEYLLSVERWPFHSEPPDHYDLLSHLLELLLSQSSTLLPLHYQHDFRPYLAYLRTPPLPFRRRPPQSNCLPCTVPRQDHCPWLEPQTNQGGISLSAPRPLAWPLLCLPPILHKSVHSSMQSCSKGSWGLSVSAAGRLHHHKHFNFTESRGGGDSVAIVMPFVQVGTYPTRNFATLGPL